MDRLNNLLYNKSIDEILEMVTKYSPYEKPYPSNLIEKIVSEGVHIRYIPVLYRTDQLYKIHTYYNFECENGLNQNEYYKILVDSKYEYIHIPDKYATSELLLQYVKHYPSSIHKYISCFTVYAVALLFTVNVYDLSHLCKPEFYKPFTTYSEFIDLCSKLVPYNGVLLKYIPNKTSYLCMSAICQTYKALEYVPDDKRTKELCYVAARQSASITRYIPIQYITTDYYINIISKYGTNLKYVPANSCTKELCLLAVKNGAYIDSVPVNLLSNEMYLACTTNIYNFIYLKLDDLPITLVQQMLKKAVTLDGLVFQLVHKKYKTRELCIEAVYNNGLALGCIPKKYITRTLCLVAVMQNGLALKYVPNKYRNIYLDVLAAKQNAKSIYNIGNHHLLCDVKIHKVIRTILLELHNLQLYTMLLGTKVYGSTLYNVPHDIIYMIYKHIIP